MMKRMKDEASEGRGWRWSEWRFRTWAGSWGRRFEEEDDVLNLATCPKSAKSQITNNPGWSHVCFLVYICKSHWHFSCYTKRAVLTSFACMWLLACLTVNDYHWQRTSASNVNCIRPVNPKYVYATWLVLNFALLDIRHLCSYCNMNTLSYETISFLVF